MLIENDIAPIKTKIYIIRNMQVMLDSDLASLYSVEAKKLNEQVKRNIERFPENFMFQLTEKEYNDLISQSVISSSIILRSQIATSKSLRFQSGTLKRGGRRYLPWDLTDKAAILRKECGLK